GWVRVGSPHWKAIQNYNASAHPTAGRGASAAGHPVLTPDGKKTSMWNPASPQYKRLVAAGVDPNGGTKATVGSDPGRGGEMAARRNPTANNGGVTTTPGAGKGGGKGGGNGGGAG